MKTIFRTSAILMTSILALSTSVAADSGFLSDYSKLKARSADSFARVYVPEGIYERLQAYRTVMVDQPEVFIAADSKYKGAKPDQLKVLSDTMRLAMMERLEAGGYFTTDQPGPDVIYMRWAVTDLYLKKKSKRVLAYTPVGFVVHTTAQAAIRDLWKKIDIVELGVEVEFLDSVSNEQLAAGVIQRGARKAKGQKKDLVTWEELDAAMKTLGERLRCNLDNAKVPEAQRQDCTQISFES